MNAASRIVLPRSLAVLLAVVLMSVGAAAMYLLLKANLPVAAGGTTATPSAPPANAASSADRVMADDGDSPLPDVKIPLAPDAAKRAGILVQRVTESDTASSLRLPGVVAPNAYRQVSVTPLVSGRLTTVPVQLGDHVRKGQTLAEVYSPELTEARTRYISATAMLEAHDRELQRTRKLVEIGAASRQELERIHAEHAAQAAAVESARSQLQLLGVTVSSSNDSSIETLSGTATIPAPIDGVITERGANVGLNVDPATKLFTVVDLSTVWVLADVHERDMGSVRIGTTARITSEALPERHLEGRISYIDPQLDAATRTARARIVLPNPPGELRLGTYVDVAVDVGMAKVGTALTVPRSAVQNFGHRTVVYLQDASAPGTFVEREVRLGRSAGEDVEILGGLQRGDSVVIAGSFSLRAERERLGLRPARTVGDGTAEQKKPDEVNSPQQTGRSTARIAVTSNGYIPATVRVRGGRPITLTFIRDSDHVCGTEVVFPALNLRRALPLNRPVDIEFTPAENGELAFTCDMNMLKGTVVVQ